MDVIPFQSSAQIQSLEVYASLRSVIGIEFEFDEVMDVTGSATAELYVDTPILRANITPVQDADINCQPLSVSDDSRQDDQEILTDVIHMTFSSAWAFGYGLGAEVRTNKYCKVGQDVR